MKTDELIDIIVKKHNGDHRSAIAWLLGYTESLEEELNLIRGIVHAEKIKPIEKRFCKSE